MSEHASLAFHIDEFCDAYGVSRSTFYRLLRQRLAPTVMRIGRRILITRDSAEKWAREMEKRSAS